MLNLVSSMYNLVQIYEWRVRYSLSYSSPSDSPLHNPYGPSLREKYGSEFWLTTLVKLRYRSAWLNFDAQEVPQHHRAPHWYSQNRTLLAAGPIPYWLVARLEPQSWVPIVALSLDYIVAFCLLPNILLNFPGLIRLHVSYKLVVCSNLFWLNAWIIHFSAVGKQCKILHGYKQLTNSWPSISKWSQRYISSAFTFLGHYNCIRVIISLFRFAKHFTTNLM